jgi:hypothetical protein
MINFTAMVEDYNGIKVIKERHLIDNGIITAENIRQLSVRNKINVVRRGCTNTSALIALDGKFPDRFMKKIEMDFPEWLTKKEKNLIAEHIIQDSAAIEFFSSYEIEPDRYLPQSEDNNVVKEYYTNAIVLNAIKNVLTTRRTMQKKLNNGLKSRWETIARDVLNLDRREHPHSLPSNERRLHDRYNQYIKEGYACLIHKNFCNKNSAKVDNDQKLALLNELIADARNLDNEQVAGLYNIVAKGMQWDTITGPAVAKWRKKFDTMNYAGRRGSVAFRNKKTMQVKRSAPTAPLYYWTLDGWDVELLYQLYDGTKTTFHNRPTAVIVLDPCVKYIIGYAIGTHETPELIQQALRNAECHTAQLFGKMYRSHQIQSDRYSIKKMTPFYEAVSKISTPARAKNAKSKVIEPYFKSLNHDYCQYEKNWSGYGIQSDKECQPNVESLNKFKKDFPDYEGVCKQFEEIIERIRASKIDAYMELWEATAEADKLEMTTENYLMTFGQTKGKPNQRESDGLHKTINGVKHTWECFNPAFRNFDHLKFDIYFDPTNMDKVLAVSEDKAHRFLLEKPYIQPMALKDRKVGDSGALQRIKEFNASLEKQVSDFRAQNIQEMADVLPIMLQNETLQKFCLTDSNGQHKNNRNDARKALPQTPKGALKSRAVDTDIETEYDPYNLY